MLRCELRSPLCTPAQPQIARTPSPSKELYEPRCNLRVASYLCSTNVHCVDGEPICANDDPHSECTSCMVATAKEYMVAKQQQIVLGGGWGIVRE